jgi:hypothetical protein
MTQQNTSIPDRPGDPWNMFYDLDHANPASFQLPPLGMGE